MPFFTVIIPLYNKAPYIERAVSSVLAQDFLDFELLVVDDGSTDNGRAVVEGIGDGRVRTVVQENLGPSMARRRGWLEARGAYLAFLDADDEWGPEFLSEMKALIDLFPNCGLYACAYEIEEGDGRLRTMRNRFDGGRDRGIVANYFRNVAAKNLLICSSAVAVDRSALSEDGFLPGRRTVGEDQYLWATIALEHRVAYSQRVLARYHRDADSSFLALGPLKEPPCFVELLAGVAEANGYRGRPLRPAFLRQIRRYVSENLVQLAILNTRAGDFRAATRFLKDPLARAKPARLALAASYVLALYLRSHLVRSTLGEREA